MQHARQSDNLIEATANFRHEQLSQLMLLKIRNMEWIKSNINANPGIVKTRLGLMHFLGAKTVNPTLVAKVHEETIQKVQNDMGEHSTRIAAKATELQVHGHVMPTSMVPSVIPNVLVIISDDTDRQPRPVDRHARAEAIARRTTERRQGL